MPVIEYIVPPLVHRPQHSAFGSVVHLKWYHSLNAGLNLRIAESGEVSVGRIEGNPSDQVAT